MFFKKKKRMIDIRELQKRGIIKIPKKDIVVPTNRDGFVELGSSNRQATNDQRPANSEFFGLTTTTNSRLQTPNSQLSATDLDNKIYKLEQRIELLEKKLNINKTTEPNLGPMGW